MCPEALTQVPHVSSQNGSPRHFPLAPRPVVLEKTPQSHWAGSVPSLGRLPHRQWKAPGLAGVRCQCPSPPRALKRQKSMTSSLLQLQLSVSEIHANRISLERIPRRCGGLGSQICWLNLPNKYFLSSYEVPGTVLGIWDSETNIISSFLLLL